MLCDLILIRNEEKCGILLIKLWFSFLLSCVQCIHECLVWKSQKLFFWHRILSLEMSSFFLRDNLSHLANNNLRRRMKEDNNDKINDIVQNEFMSTRQLFSWVNFRSTYAHKYTEKLFAISLHLQPKTFNEWANKRTKLILLSHCTLNLKNTRIVILISFSTDNGTISYFLHMTGAEIRLWWSLIYSECSPSLIVENDKSWIRWIYLSPNRKKSSRNISIKYLFLFHHVQSRCCRGRQSNNGREEKVCKRQKKKYDRDVMKKKIYSEKMNYEEVDRAWEGGNEGKCESFPFRSSGNIHFYCWDNEIFLTTFSPSFASKKKLHSSIKDLLWSVKSSFFVVGKWGKTRRLKERERKVKQKSCGMFKLSVRQTSSSHKVKKLL